MNQQTTLFDRPIVRNKDPITSHIAADKVNELGTVEAQKAFLLQQLSKHDRFGGWTLRELARQSCSDYPYLNETEIYYTLQRRACLLKDEGRIYDELNRKCKVTGNTARAWRIK